MDNFEGNNVKACVGTHTCITHLIVYPTSYSAIHNHFFSKLKSQYRLKPLVNTGPAPEEGTQPLSKD